VFARHKLNTCRQKSEEKIEEFFQYLKILSADCNFAAVTAGRNRDAAICNAFVARLWSGCIRQCLLEDNVRELQAAFDKARTLDEAQRNNCEEIACRPTQFPFIRLTLLLRAILAKRIVCPMSVCRWKQSAISAATSDILPSNALCETTFATNARRKDIFPVFVCLNL